MSNLGDNNDYHGSPTTLVWGKIIGWSKKGERGKVLELTPDAKVDLLKYDQAPQSIQLEMDKIKEGIFSGCQTADVSFYEMRNVGAVSGVTLENMYLDSSMAAKTEEEVFGEMFTRRFNVIKEGICNVINTKLAAFKDDLDCEFKFTPFIPEDRQTETGIVSTAKAAGLISEETAVGRLGLTKNADDEVKKIRKEKEENFASMQKTAALGKSATPAEEGQAGAK